MKIDHLPVLGFVGRGGGDAAEVSVFESVAVAFEGDDFGVVDEAVDHGGGDDDVVVEDLAPAAEGFVAGDDQAGAFVAGGHQLEKQVGGFGFERDVADLIDLCGYPHRSIYADTATMPSAGMKVLVNGGRCGQLLGIVRAVAVRSPSSDHTFRGRGNDERPPGVEPTTRTYLHFNLAREQRALIRAPAPDTQLKRCRPCGVFPILLTPIRLPGRIVSYILARIRWVSSIAVSSVGAVDYSSLRSRGRYADGLR